MHFFAIFLYSLLFQIKISNKTHVAKYFETWEETMLHIFEKIAEFKDVPQICFFLQIHKAVG